MPLEPRASWFSPKCVEAQQLTGHLGVKHCFGAGRESGTEEARLAERWLSVQGRKVTLFRVRRGRENASSRCSSTRRYGAEVTHAILPGKARTAFNKRVPVPETDTDHVWGLTPAQCRKVKEVGDLMTGEPATEAPVNGGRNYNGPKASQKVTEACKGFLGPDGDWPSSAKAEGSLTARPTRRAGTKVGLSDPTVPSGRAVAQRIKVTLGITG
ncbi:hypothetical protein E3N88_37990 [Mikania micrantha]|uniref:Uncharacterized protein n=1 Tax=Mikania micrantha TaxID=192012 RepID=A0A5N6LSR0_9ASTR|nr:hypothetical protein E3N88_37990 [Mikania micrantha]